MRRTTDAGEVTRTLGRRWAATLTSGEDALFSPSSALGVLGPAAEAANGDARDELSEALGVAPELAGDIARQVIVGLGEHMQGGTGFWFHPKASPRPEWLAVNDYIDVGRLPVSVEVLNQWVSDTTAGMITELPLYPDPDSLLLAVSALSVDTDWERPFMTGFGSWAGSEDTLAFVQRSDPIDTDDVGVIQLDDLGLSHVVVRSVSSLDVHLIAGSLADSAEDVLGGAFDWFDGLGDRRAAHELSVGEQVGCLRVEEGNFHKEAAFVRLPAFDLSGELRITDHPLEFGFATARDCERGHFPGFSEYPLCVSAAIQSGFASFSDKGFRAGAVTVMACMGGSAPPSEMKRRVTVEHNRPFAFFAIDRETGVVHFGGWVETSEPLAIAV